jgi:hypothetical protein
MRIQSLGKWAVYIFLTLLSLFIMINIHEIGHTVFARLFGDTDAVYYLYRVSPNGDIACIGCNVYDETTLSLLGNIFVTLGGVIFSQGVAVALLVAKHKVGRIGRFCNILVIVTLFDALFQVAQGIIANTAQQAGLTRVDFADFIWLVANQTGLAHFVIKGIILACLLVYLLWFMTVYKKARKVERSLNS